MLLALAACKTNNHTRVGGGRESVAASPSRFLSAWTEGEAGCWSAHNYFSPFLEERRVDDHRPYGCYGHALFKLFTCALLSICKTVTLRLPTSLSGRRRRKSDKSRHRPA